MEVSLNTGGCSNVGITYTSYANVLVLFCCTVQPYNLAVFMYKLTSRQPAMQHLRELHDLQKRSNLLQPGHTALCLDQVPDPRILGDLKRKLEGRLYCMILKKLSGGGPDQWLETTSSPWLSRTNVSNLLDDLL
jgi:hypothetical protein